MEIIEIKAGPKELRLYLNDILNEQYVFCSNVAEYIKKHYFLDFESIDSIRIADLKDEEVLAVLDEFDLTPESLFYIKDDSGNLLSNYHSLTKLNDKQVNEKNEGIFVFQAFRLQIYYLFNEKGQEILGPCSDLNLGLNFTIECRGVDQCFFEYYSYYEGRLEFVRLGDNFRQRFFPYKDEYDLVLNNATTIDKDNEEFVTAASLNCPLNFLYASERLQRNKPFIIEILKKEGKEKSIFPYLPIWLREDREIYSILEITDDQFNETIFNIYDYSKLKNEELVLCILNKSGSALEYLSDEFKARRDMVSLAVKSSGFAIRFAGEQLRTDKEIVCNAVKTNSQLIIFASKELQKDKDVLSLLSNQMREIVIQSNYDLDQDKLNQMLEDELPF